MALGQKLFRRRKESNISILHWSYWILSNILSSCLKLKPMHNLFEGNALFETRWIESGFMFDYCRVRLRLISKSFGWVRLSSIRTQSKLIERLEIDWARLPNVRWAKRSMDGLNDMNIYIVVFSERANHQFNVTYQEEISGQGLQSF